MLSRRRILVVDDAPENIQPLISTLKDDFAIQVAKNGPDAIKYAIEKPQPDIILLDILMPDMDGYQVCEHLKADDKTKDIPIIFVTALNDSEDEEKGLILGAVDYITKPINPQLVKARVNNHLELKLYRDHLKHQLDDKQETINTKTKEIIEKDNMLLAQSRLAAMGEMISMIAHQWRQPLSTISMEANNILADIKLDSISKQELEKTAKRINNNIEELSKTIDDFRNFFKPNKDIAKASVEDVISDSINIIGKSLENNNIEIKLDIEDVKVKTYSRDLMQVLLNIIKNAKEALLENKIQNAIVAVHTKTVSNSMVIEICDNAGGIDSNLMERIFEPYFTTKSGQNGTGLGLYISKTIIEKHLKGTISVENNGEGACFKILIPIK